MSEPAKLKTQAAAGSVLEVLARVFMEAGLGAEAFVEEAGRACVRAAHGKCVEDGVAKPKQPVVSQISAITGMPDAKVASLLRQAKTRPPVQDSGQPRTERVLAGWYQDPEFQDAAGDPTPLKVRGERGSFVALVRKYGGAKRAAPILRQLENAKAVRRLPDGRIEPLRRTVATVNTTAERMKAFAAQAVDYLKAHLRNLRSPEQDPLLRYVVNTQIDPKELVVVLAQLRRQTENYAISVEETIHHPQNTRTDSGVRLGIGIYPIGEPPVPPVGNVRRQARARRTKK